MEFCINVNKVLLMFENYTNQGDFSKQQGLLEVNITPFVCARDGPSLEFELYKA